MKIWVTKYLFTEGIQEMEGEPWGAMGAASVADHGESFGPDDWHRTREAAVAHAEKMRTKKLAALDKQRKKIEDMVIA